MAVASPRNEGPAPRRPRIPGLLAGGLLVLVLLGTTLYQIQDSNHKLPEKILRGGRVVLASPVFVFDESDPARDGHADLALDGRFDSATILAFPGPPPEGTYLLSDLALSHFPGADGSPDKILRPRSARRLRIFNGLCADCPAEEFRRYGRIKRARIEMLERRANDPDVEFLIPPARVVATIEIDFPDRPGAIDLPLELPTRAAAPAYPTNVFYIICKISVLEQYPGTHFNDRVAIAELEYTDTDLEATLQGDPRPFVWK